MLKETWPDEMGRGEGRIVAMIRIRPSALGDEPRDLVVDDGGSRLLKDAAAWTWPIEGFNRIKWR